MDELSRSRTTLLLIKNLKFGAHTRPELAFFLNVVREGDFVFGLGGHIGTYAIPLAQKIRGGKLLVVEGGVENFSVLEKNIANAGLLAETWLLNAIVAPTERRYQVSAPAGNTGGTFFVPAETDAIPTEVVTIDDLCRRYFTPRIIKLDIEGYEVFALAGSKVIEQQHPVVYAEINARALSQQGATVHELDSLLRELGYRLFRNIGERHAAHDNFIMSEVHELIKGDVLAIHQADERLQSVVSAPANR